jgi:hypothetical protein
LIYDSQSLGVILLGIIFASKYEDIDRIMALLMQIMPKIKEAIWGHLTSSSISGKPNHHGDKVNEAAALTLNSKALFARELCDLSTCQFLGG